MLESVAPVIKIGKMAKDSRKPYLTCFSPDGVGSLFQVDSRAVKHPWVVETVVEGSPAMLLGPKYPQLPLP